LAIALDKNRINSNFRMTNIFESEIPTRNLRDVLKKFVDEKEGKNIILLKYKIERAIHVP
jgi:hypothetical protein